MNDEPAYEIEAAEEPGTPLRKGFLMRRFSKAGDGSLAISLLVHGLFVVIALLIIWRVQLPEDKIDIDTGGSGGGGTAALKHINENKVRLILNRAPRASITHAGPSAFSMPEARSTLTSLSTVSQSGMMSGTPGTGGMYGGGNDSGIGPDKGPGRGTGGKGMGTAFFGALPRGNNIIFCIDTSGSMRVNLTVDGIAALRRELKKVISDLPATVSFNLICFGQSADLFKGQSVPATPERKNEALRFLENYYGGAGADFGRTRTERYGRAGKDSNGIEYTPLLPADIEELAGTEGGSRIDLAMVAAFERNPTTLFVLSDGAPGTRKTGADQPMDKGALIELIHAKYREVIGGKSALLVNTISIYSDTDEGREGAKFLRQLAQKFGGKHREVKPDRLK
ncbi:MAG TPA: hypothetical protein VHM91_23960 [Verrucomicrobiales bacterium]|nr:hypothetical protein [Verrucomicrobiales bacterium]